MKRVKFNKKLLLIFIFILGIGTTLAYFTSNFSIPNIFNSARYETTTTEEFTSPNDWKPGDTTPKTVITTNNSNLPIRVRISVEESWTDKNNNNLSLEENNTLAAILDLDNRPDWIYEDGYYYYKYDLPPGESTNSFIKSVTFNKEIVGEYICTTENNVEQCDSASDTYQDANYKLNIKVETTQASNYLDAWGLSRAPRRVAPTYCTYEGELVQGAEYVNGQYTYKYMQQKKSSSEWEDMEDVGWGVALTDRDSEEPVTTPLCTYINDVPVISASYMLYNSKTTSIDTSSFDTSEIKNMKYMLGMLRNINDIDVSNFETSNVTNMNYIFYSNYATSLDVSSFDTSKVTNMAGMFSSSQVKALDLSSFDTSNVTDMLRMFSGCKANVINVKSFDTSKVTDMSLMFNSTTALSIDLSSFDTSNVTNMRNMFSSSNFEVIDLSGFNTSNVTNMSSMFLSCENLEEIIGIEDWDVSRVTTFAYMFYMTKLKRLDLKKWNTQSVTGTGLDTMFRNCSELEYLDVRNFDTSAATSYEGMFCNDAKITYLNIANFDSQNVEIFYYFTVNMYAIKELDFSGLKTNKVRNMGYLFHRLYQLEKIYISDLWSTESVTYNPYMFYGNNKLTGEINNRYTMKPRINELTLADTSTRTIHLGESITIPTVSATYTDNSVVVKNSEDLIWKSSNLDIAKANLGVIKGISPGEATITIKSGIVETTFNVVIVE